MAATILIDNETKWKAAEAVLSRYEFVVKPLHKVKQE